MYHIKNDQRSIRSSQMMYEALADLIREKAYASIKVTEIVERAQVGRATFYRNFDTIDDILLMRCDQAIEEMMGYIMQYWQTYQNARGIALLRPVLHYFETNSEIIELLLLARRIDLLHKALGKTFHAFKPSINMMNNTTHNTMNVVPLAFVDYVIAVRIGVLTSILVHWVENGKRETPDELADGLGKMAELAISLGDLS